MHIFIYEYIDIRHEFRIYNLLDNCFTQYNSILQEPGNNYIIFVPKYLWVIRVV